MKSLLSILLFTMSLNAVAAEAIAERNVATADSSSGRVYENLKSGNSKAVLKKARRSAKSKTKAIKSN